MVKKKPSLLGKKTTSLKRKGKKLKKGVVKGISKRNDTLFDRNLNGTKNYVRYDILPDPNIKKDTFNNIKESINPNLSKDFPEVPEAKVDYYRKYSVRPKEVLILNELIKKHGENYNVLIIINLGNGF
jgi:hypothetical protein